MVPGPPDSSVHGILQAGILEWVAISFSRGFLHPGIEPTSPTLQGELPTTEPPGKPISWLLLIKFPRFPSALGFGGNFSVAFYKPFQNAY